MATATVETNVGETGPRTVELRLASGNGPVVRQVLRTPPRDASPSEIPIIDISPTFSDVLEDRLSVARQIHEAATNTGFFYIKNHGVSADAISDAHATCLDFFHDDMEIKKRAKGKSTDVIQTGYRGPNSHIMCDAEGLDVCESYSMRYDPSLDPTIADTTAIPEHAAKYLISPDQWEKTASRPRFNTVFRRYFQECLELARVLTRAFALALGLPEDAFDTKVQYPQATINLLFYPPLNKQHGENGNDGNDGNEDGEERVSLGSHTDFQLFTILWQDNNGGLQVLSNEGQWLRAQPVEGTFVVNIGDYLQRITNGRYVSTVHRARNRSGRERVSMPFFWGFGLHESCAVLDTCVAEGEEKKYDEVRCLDWFRRRLKDTYVEEEAGQEATGLLKS